MTRDATPRDLENISDHFIVCGAGRMGRVIVDEMKRAGAPFTVIESDAARVVSRYSSDGSLLIIEGDATKEQCLLQAGIDRAKGPAACLADDADNLIIVHDGARPAARYRDCLRRLRRGVSRQDAACGGHARRVPERYRCGAHGGGLVAAVRGQFPRCRDRRHGHRPPPGGCVIPSTSALVGKTLADAKIPQETGLIVLALRRSRDDRSPTFNPGPETRLQAGDIMIVLGSQDQVQKLRKYASSGALEV